MEMLQWILVAFAFASGSFFIGYVVRSYWFLLAPVLGCVCFFAMAAGIEPSGDGGAEWAAGVLFLLAMGALVLGAPSMLIGVVWGRAKSQAALRGRGE